MDGSRWPIPPRKRHRIAFCHACTFRLLHVLQPFKFLLPCVCGFLLWSNHLHFQAFLRQIDATDQFVVYFVDFWQPILQHVRKHWVFVYPIPNRTTSNFSCVFYTLSLDRWRIRSRSTSWNGKVGRQRRS